MAEQIHLGDVGTELRFLVTESDVVVDLSTASTLSGKFRTPTNRVKTETLVFVNSGTDGLLKYTTISGFLDETGGWDAQVVITFAAGSTWSTDIVNFHVHPNI